MRGREGTQCESVVAASTAAHQHLNPDTSVWGSQESPLVSSLWPQTLGPGSFSPSTDLQWLLGAGHREAGLGTHAPDEVWLRAQRGYFFLKEVFAYGEERGLPEWVQDAGQSLVPVHTSKHDIDLTRGKMQRDGVRAQEQRLLGLNA